MHLSELLKCMSSINKIKAINYFFNFDHEHVVDSGVPGIMPFNPVLMSAWLRYIDNSKDVLIQLQKNLIYL